MLYVLIVLIAIALIIFTLSFPFVTISVHYKDLRLELNIKHLIYKKTLFFDLSKEKKTVQKKNKKPKPENFADEKREGGIKSKISAVKDRIYSPENGFDIDEVKKVKDEYTKIYSEIFKILSDFLKKTRFKIHIPSLRIKLEYGTGNPANTGLIYGSIWGLVGILYPLLARYFHIIYPQMDITPDFYGKRFNTEIKSIIKVRPTHIINAAVTALWIPMLTYIKNILKKGRDK